MALTTRLLATALVAGALVAGASSSTASSWAVSAVNGRGQAAASAAPAPPPTPTTTCTSSAAVTVVVNWSVVARATGYTVYQSTSPSGPFSAAATVTSPPWTSANLAAGSTYYWKVATKIQANWVSAQSAVSPGRTISNSNPKCS